MEQQMEKTEAKGWKWMPGGGGSGRAEVDGRKQAGVEGPEWKDGGRSGRAEVNGRRQE